MVQEYSTTLADTPSMAVVWAVADYVGIDPGDFDHPLANTIDPDALDALIEEGASSVTTVPLSIQFDYAGCEIQIIDNGTLTIAHPAKSPFGGE